MILEKRFFASSKTLIFKSPKWVWFCLQFACKKLQKNHQKTENTSLSAQHLNAQTMSSNFSLSPALKHLPTSETCKCYYDEDATIQEAKVQDSTKTQGECGGL